MGGCRDVVERRTVALLRRPVAIARCNVRVVLALVRVRVRLWRDPKAAVRVARGGVEREANPGEVGQIAAAIGRWRRVIPGATCLVQAIATQELLVAEGHPAELFFGVTVADDALSAHAWVELNGAVVVGGGPNGHTVLGSVAKERATRPG